MIFLSSGEKSMKIDELTTYLKPLIYFKIKTMELLKPFYGKILSISYISNKYIKFSCTFLVCMIKYM